MLQDALKQEYKRRCDLNPSYSVRAYAQSLGINSGSLTSILNGKRSIGPKVAKKLLSELELSGWDKNKFFKDQFGLNEPKRSNSKKLKRQLEEDEIELISSWEHFAILSYLETPQSKTLVSISNKFNLPIGRCRQALERLARLNLISHEDGKWNLIGEDCDLETTHDIPNFAIRKAHKEYIQLASDSIEQHHVEDREIIGTTLAIDPNKLPEAKKRIRTFLDDLSKYMNETNKEEVYRINLQLFPCGKRVMGKRRIQ
jgi:uncharacterized protein (TIGR02147 family)